jgi:hypothetical protein
MATIAVVGDRDERYETHRGSHSFHVGTMFQPQVRPERDGREHPLLDAFFAAVRSAS